MKSNFRLVEDFHKKFDAAPPPALAEGLTKRMAFLEEEVKEVKEAIAEVTNATPETLATAKAHVLKELIDVLYITYGTLNLLNVDVDAAFAEVHRSNMSKTPAGGATSKAIKGPEYTPAQMEQFV
jgi:predicted HAD superfamily Cof-like phosphohydrolase